MTKSNSIRTNLTASSVQNEIRLLLSVPKNKYATMILLEGIDDIKLFVSLINNKNTYLFESYGGKPGIKDILCKFTFDYRVIGIADRDYETQNIPRLFYCDYCNAEMMIASNDDSLSYTLFQITSNWLDISELRKHVLDKLFYFSIIRKLNEELCWGISFEEVPLNEIIINHSDLYRIIALINLKNRSNKLEDDRVSLIESEAKKLAGQNLLNCTNGHDFCKGMLKELKKLYPHTRSVTCLNADEFSSFIRIGYHKNHFKESNLYNALVNYQIEHDLYIV